MKVLFVITRSEIGGAQRHVFDLAEYVISSGAVRRAADVGVLSGEPGWLLQRAAALGAETFVVPALGRSIAVGRDIAAVRSIAKVIKAFQPDLVHSHSSKAGALAAIAGSIARVPTVFTAHGWSFDGGTSSTGRRAALAAEIALRPFRSAVITVSEKDRRLAERFRVARPSRLHLVRNGVRDHGIRAAHVEADSERPQVLTVTRIVPQKDTMTLLRAIARTNADVRLTIVGDGPQRTTMESLRDELGLHDRVRFVGESDDVPSLLRDAQIFVLSSRWEGLPMVILEAMAAGLPVVASDVGGVSECVDERNGILVAPSDPKGMANALDRLAGDPIARARLGQAGHDRFTQEFSFDRMGRETVDVYRKVLG